MSPSKPKCGPAASKPPIDSRCIGEEGTATVGDDEYDQNNILNIIKVRSFQEDDEEDGRAQWPQTAKLKSK